MRISGVDNKPAVDRGRAMRRPAAGGPLFGQVLAETAVAQDPAATASLGAACGADALLGIQEVDTATDRRARGRAVQRADTLLDHLGDIQAALLAGAVPAGRLSALADTLRGAREGVEDPRLNALIDEIELRAAVELAKFGRGG